MILVGMFSDKMRDRLRCGRPTRFWQKIFKKYKAFRVPDSQSLKE